MQNDVIFLVGFMGCGKSVVGKALAARLNYSFYDTDEMVEKKDGRSIEEIFNASGEGYFREREWEALLSLKGVRNSIISTGGGLFLGAQHRRLIKGEGISLWLDVPFKDILERLKTGPLMPLLRDEIELKQMFESRKGRYSLADFQIRTGGLTADQIMEKILAAVGS